VRFVPPAFALADINEVPRYRQIRVGDSGCRLWWLEYGGRLDTVHDTEEIKWKLWRVAYGVWDYIKNSGAFPESENLTLEWVGTVPGKRESRRFEGDVILVQRDLVEQRTWEDAVSFGGWAMDLHPADGVYSPLAPCTQWHSKGVYQIPYHVMYSRNVGNLFLTGRIISVSHVAFGSTRVMATCGHNGQAVGMAAALCRRNGVLPRDVPLEELQRELLKAGQHIPNLRLNDPEDLAATAAVETSSDFVLDCFEPNGETQPLDTSRAMLLPIPAGPLPFVTFIVDVSRSTTLLAEIRGSGRAENYTPDVLLHRQTFELQSGTAQTVRIGTDARVESPRYVSYCLVRNADIAVHLSDVRVTGVLSLSQSMNQAVAKGARQEPPPGSGIDSFEFWLPSRRPQGKNFALSVEPPIRCFGGENLVNGFARPWLQPNVWVAARTDYSPRFCLRWAEPQTITRIELTFDTDFDHPMESVLMGHPERAVPFCVKRFEVVDGRGHLLFECRENHQTRSVIRLPRPISISELAVRILETWGAPAAIFSMRCYRA
jgi:hypothetical protein